MCGTTLLTWMNNKKLWTAINAVEPFPFLGGGSADELDYMTKLNYGQRLMFSAFVAVQVDDIASHIVKLYADKWNALISFNAQSGNIGADKTRRITNSKNTIGKVTNTGASADKVSAFNSDVLVTDTGRDSTDKEDSTVDVTGTTTDETFNYKSAFENLSLIEQTNIINTALKDVVKYLTISVY